MFSTENSEAVKVQASHLTGQCPSLYANIKSGQIGFICSLFLPFVLEFLYYKLSDKHRLYLYTAYDDLKYIKLL